MAGAGIGGRRIHKQLAGSGRVAIALADRIGGAIGAGQAPDRSFRPAVHVDGDQPVRAGEASGGDGQRREQAAIQDFLALALVGGPETVRQGFAQIQQSTEADELILVTDIHGPALRLRSLEISAQALAG